MWIVSSTKDLSGQGLYLHELQYNVERVGQLALSQGDCCSGTQIQAQVAQQVLSGAYGRSLCV